MDNLEEKLGAVLNNPEMMSKIMSMAQALGSSEPAAPREAPKADPPMPDMAMLQRLSGMARQTGIDREQQSLLKALHPYLSAQRLRKLENAMRAAKMAKLAASALGVQGGKLPFGR